MKKSMLISGLVAGSMVYAHADTQNINHPKTNKKISEVFEWSVQTKQGVYTGTSLNLDQVNKDIALATKNTEILKKNIAPIALISNTNKETIYTWSVTTKSGHASGISTDIDEAKKIIRAFSNKEIIESSIIESSFNLK